MTYDSREASARDGEPIELYRFNVGLAEWLFTSADVNFVHLGKTYVSGVFVDRDPLQVTDETPRESLLVRVARDNPAAALFTSQAPDGTMFLTIYREHRGETDFIQLGRWRVLAANWKGSQCELGNQPLFTSLARALLKLRFSRTCIHETFDGGCGLSKSDWQVPATVIDQVGTVIQAAEFAGFADGYFKGGELDAGAGRTRRILAHVDAAVTLTSNIPGIAGGDAVTAYPGDDKRIDGDCLTKFNNTINNLSFPDIPDENLFEVGIQ